MCQLSREPPCACWPFRLYGSQVVLTHNFTIASFSPEAPCLRLFCLFRVRGAWIRRAVLPVRDGICLPERAWLPLRPNTRRVVWPIRCNVCCSIAWYGCSLSRGQKLPRLSAADYQTKLYLPHPSIMVGGVLEQTIAAIVRQLHHTRPVSVQDRCYQPLTLLAL